MFEFYSQNLLLPNTCFSRYSLAPCNALWLVLSPGPPTTDHLPVWLNLFEMILDLPNEI